MPDRDDANAMTFPAVDASMALPDAHDSGVAVERAGTGEQQVVNYFFPVEVVIVGNLSDSVMDEMETRLWEKLGKALDHRV
jgi:hypothetical protein